VLVIDDQTRKHGKQFARSSIAQTECYRAAHVWELKLRRSCLSTGGDDDKATVVVAAALSFPSGAGTHETDGTRWRWRECFMREIAKALAAMCGNLAGPPTPRIQS
jgi:hypothetical protein